MNSLLDNNHDDTCDESNFPTARSTTESPSNIKRNMIETKSILKSLTEADSQMNNSCFLFNCISNEEYEDFKEKALELLIEKETEAESLKRIIEAMTKQIAQLNKQTEENNTVLQEYYKLQSEYDAYKVTYDNRFMRLIHEVERTNNEHEVKEREWIKDINELKEFNNQLTNEISYYQDNKDSLIVNKKQYDDEKNELIAYIDQLNDEIAMLKETNENNTLIYQKDYKKLRLKNLCLNKQNNLIMKDNGNLLNQITELKEKMNKNILQMTHSHQNECNILNGSITHLSQRMEEISRDNDYMKFQQTAKEKKIKDFIKKFATCLVLKDKEIQSLNNQHNKDLLSIEELQRDKYALREHINQLNLSNHDQPSLMDLIGQQSNDCNNTNDYSKIDKTINNRNQTSYIPTTYFLIMVSFLCLSIAILHFN